ncbi:hypothetical protein BU24DRAFT_360239 [Aaosphaeria arxii CBS 175.79]|uniref:Zn(2)-C6 fungal-type domain-containing protein n=1 Tax=Aaosphaeria arxii CBS 175.79 TaxID=1450172 RepID=A0A6A5X6H4_9PLEO|nr:uncharacterized protein BU24DRAFT_360239 [Aaosphaeria arxii CBS 175.79]KAF2008553.1 hypothetical protein BU24DRAFT_360239 [Aaosphaeria arxii CBS 175.79]
MTQRNAAREPTFGSERVFRNGNPGVEPKARKACTNCRKQKMRCLPGNGNICRRCYRSGLPCIFIPRANAANVGDLVPSQRLDAHFQVDVLQRLRTIEEILGIGCPESTEEATSNSRALSDNVPSELRGFQALWEALRTLQENCTNIDVPSAIWNKNVVGELWSSFQDRMPGLHFMPKKQTFSSPQPLLLVAILHFSSVRGPPETAELSPSYFRVFNNAIAHLLIPESAFSQPPQNDCAIEEWAFQTVLGIVLAGLLNEASIPETGLWISVAYRLILEHCPAHVDETSREWRKLFSGVQIIDLEHASLHLSCPVIPMEAPLPGLRTSHRDQLNKLSRMMHTGLTHFTGRGLPTIWSCFQYDKPLVSNLASSFTAVDAAVIRDWARQLDEWLEEFSTTVEGSEHTRHLVFRQYVLHRMVVLSIYHTARGCDLWSSTVTPKEQHELLLSARATIRLHVQDDTIWANWDLVMITWAALILLQGIEGNAGEVNDLDAIKVHLDKLKQANDPKPLLHTKLITRLDGSLQKVNTHKVNDSSQQNYTTLDVDSSWHIFDQASLEQMNFGSWSYPGASESTQWTDAQI